MKTQPTQIASMMVGALLLAVGWGIYQQGETTVWGLISGGISAWIWLLVGFLPLLIWLILKARKRQACPLWICLIPALLGFVGYVPDIETGASEEARGLKVFCFNIEHGAAGQDRLARYIQTQDPDVIFLQEAGPLEKFPGFATPELRRAFADRQLCQSKFELIAVKGTILKSGVVPLPRTELERDRKSPKTLLWATARIDGRNITLLNLHISPSWPGEALKHGNLPKQLSQVTRVKTEQMGIIRRVLKNRPGPAIVAGDFNQRMVGPLYDALCTEAPDMFAAKAKGLFPNRIDGIFARGFVPVRSARGPDNLSDHAPLIVWLDTASSSSRR